jgi:hypothetical protein
MPNFYSQRLKLRFYVEGYELDVQDPTFFMDEDEYSELSETLDEMLDTYGKSL